MNFRWYENSQILRFESPAGIMTSDQRKGSQGPLTQSFLFSAPNVWASSPWSTIWLETSGPESRIWFLYWASMRAFPKIFEF